MTAPSPPSVILYDADCGFCLRWVERLRRADRDRAFEFLACLSPERAARFPGIVEADCLAAMCLVLPDGGVLSGADAFARILRRLPRWRPLGFCLGLPGIRHVARVVYRWIARNRHRLGGGTAACEVRPPGGRGGDDSVEP